MPWLYRFFSVVSWSRKIKLRWLKCWTVWGLGWFPRKQLLLRHSKIQKETETKDKNVTLISAGLEMSSPRNTSNLKHATCCLWKSALYDTYNRRKLREEYNVIIDLTDAGVFEFILKSMRLFSVFSRSCFQMRGTAVSDSWIKICKVII